jgi:signal transduction histidine kinase
MISPRGSRWTVLIGLSVVGAMFVGAAIANTLLIASSIKTTRTLQERSLESVEVLSRIVRDLDEQRILVDDHIEEDRAEAMLVIERNLFGVGDDLRRAEARYADLVEPGQETELWQRAELLISRYHDTQEQTLGLSRRNENDEAHARMGRTRSDFGRLDRTLYQLIEVNRAQSLGATQHIESLQRSTERIMWVARILTLLVLGVLGRWMVRRVGDYEKRINDYARRLEERNRDLDAFAGRVAHDLKNAIAPVALAPATLRRLQGNPQRLLEVADRIERSARRAAGVVDSLLAFSRASQAADADEAASLKDVLRDVIDEVAVRAGDLDVSIEVADVPDVQVKCTPGLLRIVLANLAGNAVKYLEGCPERRVRITAVNEGASCRIDVEDTGPGIPKDAHQRIFEPFYRVEGTRAPGTGIGLATVRRIVDARGGEVTVESTVGRGSRFRVWLPLAARSDDRPESGESAEKPAARH